MSERELSKMLREPQRPQPKARTLEEIIETWPSTTAFMRAIDDRFEQRFSSLPQKEKGQQDRCISIR